MAKSLDSSILEYLEAHPHQLAPLQCQLTMGSGPRSTIRKTVLEWMAAEKPPKEKHVHELPPTPSTPPVTPQDDPPPSNPPIDPDPPANG